jgi:hypothetical protein
VKRKKLGLVACGKRKAPQTAPARLLYNSPLFRKASAFCAKTYDAWFILRAKHGLLDPEEPIAPYDLSLKTLSAEERRTWAKRVLGQIEERGLGDATFFIHAGDRYATHLLPYLRAERPVAGLGIGKQLAWYREHGF